MHAIALPTQLNPEAETRSLAAPPLILLLAVAILLGPLLWLCAIALVGTDHGAEVGDAR